MRTNFYATTIAITISIAGCQTPHFSCEQYIDSIQREDCKKRTVLPPIYPEQEKLKKQESNSSSLCYKKSTGEQICPN
jgi:hypothetical protein